jgi:hypothetical protein
MKRDCKERRFLSTLGFGTGVDDRDHPGLFCAAAGCKGLPCDTSIVAMFSIGVVRRGIMETFAGLWYLWKL